jgi:hypothetical protein
MSTVKTRRVPIEHVPEIWRAYTTNQHYPADPCDDQNRLIQGGK